MCPHCRAFITTNDRVCPYCNEKVGARAVDRSSDSPILGFIPAVRFNTIVILLINFGLYVATTIYSMRLAGGEATMNIDGRVLYAFGEVAGDNELVSWGRRGSGTIRKRAVRKFEQDLTRGGVDLTEGGDGLKSPCRKAAAPGDLQCHWGHSHRSCCSGDFEEVHRRRGMRPATRSAPP